MVHMVIFITYYIIIAVAQSYGHTCKPLFEPLPWGKRGKRRLVESSRGCLKVELVSSQSFMKTLQNSHFFVRAMIIRRVDWGVRRRREAMCICIYMCVCWVHREERKRRGWASHYFNIHAQRLVMRKTRREGSFTSMCVWVSKKWENVVYRYLPTFLHNYAT